MATTTLWVRLSLDFARNKKIAGLSDAAFRTLVEMILWSREFETDGVIPAALAHRVWGAPRNPEITQNETDSVMKTGVLETDLVIKSLSDPLSELLHNDTVSPSLTRNCDGDYIIHDYAEHQETKDTIDARKRRNSANGRLGGRPPKKRLETDSVMKTGVLETDLVSSCLATGNQKRKQSTEYRDIYPFGTSKDVPQGGMGGKQKNQGTRIPDEFTLTHAMRIWASENTPDVDIEFHTDDFIDYWQSATGQRATKRDWTRAWQNWMRRHQTETTRRTRPRRNTPTPTTSTTDENVQAWLNMCTTPTPASETPPKRHLPAPQARKQPATVPGKGCPHESPAKRPTGKDDPPPLQHPPLPLDPEPNDPGF